MHTLLSGLVSSITDILFAESPGVKRTSHIFTKKADKYKFPD